MDRWRVAIRKPDLLRARGSYIVPGPNYIWSIEGNAELEVNCNDNVEANGNINAAANAAGGLLSGCSGIFNFSNVTININN